MLRALAEISGSGALGEPMRPNSGVICAMRGTPWACTASATARRLGRCSSTSKRSRGLPYSPTQRCVPQVETMIMPMPPRARVVRKAMVSSLGRPSGSGLSTAMGASTSRFLMVRRLMVMGSNSGRVIVVGSFIADSPGAPGRGASGADTLNSRR